MEQRLSDSSSFSRSGYLPEATRVLLFIHDTGASGRLSLRNSEHAALVHLYFNEARLTHVAGNTRSAEVLLNELLTWTHGSVRFDAGLLVTYETLTWQQARAYARWLAFIEMRGLLQGIPRERLQGLTQRMTAQLPGEPIALPAEIAHYEEYVEAAHARQRQRISEGVQQLIQSVQETVESFKQTIGQKVESAFAQAAQATHSPQAGSLLPPELQARSIRNRSQLSVPNASKPVTADLNDVQ
jgi:hypothetical protein